MGTRIEEDLLGTLAIDDDQYFSGTAAPMRKDAFELDDDAKIDRIEEQFRKIMMVLGLDLADDSLRNTPRRVAKMFVKEIFQDLHRLIQSVVHFST